MVEPVAPGTASQPGGLSLVAEPSGAWFQVEVDPAVGDDRTDLWWRLAARADGVEVLEERGPCRPADDPPVAPFPCPFGDGRLTASTGDVVIGGHRYLFAFGHDTREVGVDLQPFRSILRSFRAKR